MKKNKLKKESPIKTILYYLLMTIFMVAAIIPFYVVVVSSITSYSELSSTMEFVWWPKQGIDLSSYLTVLKNDMFATTPVPTLILGFINTFWIAAVSCIGKLFFSGLAAYSYAKLKFKAKEKLFILELATMMVPTACLVMPSFMFYRFLGWTDSYLPVIIPGLFGSATIIFFLRSFFESIPTEIIEAGKIDGLSTFKCYTKLIMPLALPAFIAQFIFTFVGIYNSYTGPLLYLTQDSQITLQLALTQITNSYKDYTNIKCAAAVIGIIPMVIVYLAAQKYFLQGLSEGSVKG